MLAIHRRRIKALKQGIDACYIGLEGIGQDRYRVKVRQAYVQYMTQVTLIHENLFT